MPSETVLCAEHTGSYGDLLVYLSNQCGVPIALVSGYSVKHSLDLVKGKSDTKDASRLREYGMNNVANKMLRTIYAVLKTKTPYSSEHICIDPREIKTNRFEKKGLKTCFLLEYMN